jgi:hypothetical protein
MFLHNLIGIVVIKEFIADTLTIMGIFAHNFINNKKGGNL